MKNWKNFPRVVLFLVMLTSMLAGVSLPALEETASAAPMRQAPDVDVSLSMSVDNAAPYTGTNIVITITVVNSAGSASASGVAVTDVLPAGLTYISHTTTPVGGSYNSGTGVWTIGSLAPGASTILNITANTGTSASKLNSAIVSSTETDVDTSNNVGSVNINPIPVSNLGILKVVNNSTPNINDNIVFSITVTNAGPDTATTIIINDVLPPGLTYVSDNGGGTYNSSTGRWTITSLSNGSSAILRITARVTSIDPKTNTASVVSLDQTDLDGSNNASSVIITPVGGGVADLSLTHSYAKSSPGTAGYVVLTTTVTNGGPYNATNVVVLNKLPDGLVYISYTSDGGGSYNKDTGLWNVGSIPTGTGNTRSLRVTARIAETGSRTSSATISSADQSDLNIANNSASVTIPYADLSITLVMNNVTPTVGTDVVFTIRVTNSGPNNVTGVVVKDKLSTNYTYSSDDSISIGDIYDPVTGYWTVGNLNSGDTATLNITATVASTTASTMVNWAEVWAVDLVDIDSVPGDSSQSSDDDASAPAADLRIDQVVSSTYPGVNVNFTYTITVTNDGTVGTTGVRVKDKLPSGVTYVSYTSTVPVSGTTGTYTYSTGYWEVGTLATGQSQILTITAKITTSGVRTNWAEVWASNLPDPDSTPRNSSTTEDDDASTVVSYRPILINEVAWAGTASTLPDDQWIELYNPSSVAVDITGWTLRTSEAIPSPNITLNGTIAAGGYFLLERDNNSTVSDVAASQFFTGSLSTSGEVLTLRDTNSNVIDTANGNGGGWPKGGGTNYASMERVGNTTENDSAWVTNTGVTRNGVNANGDKIYGTPGGKNSTGVAPAATPVVVPPTAVPVVRPIMNEFLARPGFDWNQDGRVDVFDEFIEVKNIGITDVTMTGWTLELDTASNSTTFEIPTLILKPGQRAVFYGLQTKILLSDGGGTVRLSNPSGKIYDAYTYSVVKVEDQSVCRLPDGNGQWYEDCVPTPNLTNSREGEIPSMPEGEAFESTVCDLPDTLPADFLFAECRGYGAAIWHSFFWDQYGWQGDQYAPENSSKWESFVE
jgi:uncharacterized repeat protein (TIGR01451 family)